MWVGVRLGLAIQCRVMMMGLGSFVCGGDGVLKSLKSSSVVWFLVLASIVISLRSCGEYMVPPPLNAALMDAYVSWHVALCLLMNWLL